jgi:ribosomal protein L10
MGPRKATKKTRESKEHNWEKFQELCTKYNKAIFVEGDNVSSLQMTKIRAALRKIGAELIMGKNTLLKASLARFMTKPVEGDFDYETRKDSFKERPELEKFNGLLKGNTGIIFSNGGLSAIKEVQRCSRQGWRNRSRRCVDQSRTHRS